MTYREIRARLEAEAKTLDFEEAAWAMEMLACIDALLAAAREGGMPDATVKDVIIQAFAETEEKLAPFFYRH